MFTLFWFPTLPCRLFCFIFVGFMILVGCQAEQKACLSKFCFSSLTHAWSTCFSTKFREHNRVYLQACSCVSWVYFKSPKLRLETLNVSLTNSEKFDIHQETQIHILSALGRIWAGVLLYRASPNRAFEASKLGHPACDSGINSNTN